MVKMTYKKRKNVKKQSFKKRNKKMKGGGPNEENTANDATDANASANSTNAAVDANATDANATNAAVDANATNVTDANAVGTDENASQVKEGATTEVKEGSSAPVADESAETPVADDSWKEGVSEEEVKAAEEKVKNIEGMGKEEINNLAKELANAPGTPLWAKALAKSGAAGKVAEFLEEHPELKKALIDKGIKMVENANVSGGPKTTASTEGNTTQVGNPEENAGYKQFLEDLKANPDDTLRKNVYIWPSVEGLYIYDGEKWVNHKNEVIEDDTGAETTNVNTDAAAAGTNTTVAGTDANNTAGTDANNTAGTDATNAAGTDNTAAGTDNTVASTDTTNAAGTDTTNAAGTDTTNAAGTDTTNATESP